VRECIHKKVNEIRRETGRAVRKRVCSREIHELIEYLFKKVWVVNAETRLSSGVHTIRYIGRYSKRPVIAESRIISYDGDYVRFLCDKEEEIFGDEDGKSVVVKMMTKEFIVQLLRHVPDKGFRMINHFGLYAACKWNKVKRRLMLALKVIEKRVKALKWNEWIGKCFGRDPLKCPNCGGRMLLYTIHYLKDGCMKVKRYLLDGGYIVKRANRAWIGGVGKFTKVGNGGQLSFV